MRLLPPLLVLGATVSLILARPRVGRLGRLHPTLAALAGAASLGAMGILSAADVASTVAGVARPLLTVAAIMATTGAAHAMGIFDRLARIIELRTRGPVERAFAMVFLIAAAMATVFNNDAAILILTPIVVPLIARLYPKRPYLVEPFALAIFVAAGVAPLSTSNPMNLVVAERAGISFHGYALRMIPVALVSSYVSYRMLRWAYRRELDDKVPAGGPEQGSLAPMEEEPLVALLIVLAVLVAYPVVSLLGGPVWVVALTGAVLTGFVGLRHGSVSARAWFGGVAWEVLLFMVALLCVATGLKNAGLLDAIAALYKLGGEHIFGQVAVVGALSAVGSALLNNHPMAALNALAVERLAGDPTYRVLAALVGGDLGPRLLPMGSLAGLLWLDLLRRMGAAIPTRRFLRMGLVTTPAALAVGLLVLWAESLLFP
ncbi:MAG: hypothetical protein IPG50_07920 [Myxococcales bacterium]|nr:hypothetical protein [Myxococcales bacterium]